MLRLSLIFFASVICALAQIPQPGASSQDRKEAAVEFNRLVTDEEIMEYLEFQYSIDPQMLASIREAQSSPAKLEQYLTNYRNFHNEIGSKIPVLSDLSETELEELRVLFEIKKKEYYDSLAAADRLEKLSKAELILIVEVAKALMKNFEPAEEDRFGRPEVMTDGFPSKLDFLKLQYIYPGQSSCALFLHKGIGKGIGLEVSKHDKEWRLFSFNEYVSWERTELDYENP